MAGPIASVVTGDVNASTRMAVEEARRLEAMLETCYHETAAALPQAGLSGYTGFRGDAWQFTSRRPELVVRATIFYRCRLLMHSDREFRRRLHTSAAIGFGTVDYTPDSQSSAGGGEAYENSGRRLDRLRRRIPGMGAAGAGEVDPYLDVLLGVFDALIRQWTANQAEAVALAIQGLVQAEIARLWEPPITQQAVHKHLAAAGWPGLEPALEWCETTLKGCFSNHSL